ncbi:MAG TPA: glycoside hydrolase family 28 protein [Verrucomicrobiae bacterium]|nr:glycoside hydrolase family 28 protein [Verrucomicrobiae bacterium]
MKNLLARPSLLLAALVLGQAILQSAIAADTGDKSFYNVRSYGATGDGKTLDSPAIDKAIQAATEAGGGTVYLPPGTYLSGTIHLASNIHLFIDMGATILAAPQNMNAYDEPKHWEGTAYQDGGHTYFRNSLIYGEGLTNVSITGQGMINGSALSAGDGKQDDVDGFKDWQHPAPASGDVKLARLGNKAIALKLCRNVVLRDITIFRGGHFAILTTGCDNMTVDNVTMDTNRDGIDIDCCRNVMVSNCRINSPNDDGLCPKSSFALGRNVITENMTIVNCMMSGFEIGSLIDGTLKPKANGNGNGRLKFGTEANGGFRNVTVANCVFRSCRGLALEEVDGGVLENININNITMMDVPSYAIYVTTGKRNRGPEVKQPSRMRNVLISNVTADGVSANGGIQIFGLPEQPIEGLRLENIRLVCKGGGTKEQAKKMPPELGTGYPEPHGVMPAYGVFASHVRGLELANINLSVEKEDGRPAMVCSDVDGLEIDNFKAQLPATKDVTGTQPADGERTARFENVRGLVVRNSPVLKDMTPIETR